MNVDLSAKICYICNNNYFEILKLNFLSERIFWANITIYEVNEQIH
jgi:hypothetical protein